MADIIFDCPECGRSLQVEEKGAGRKIDCPECGKNIEIPMTGSNGNSIPSPSPSLQESVPTDTVSKPYVQDQENDISEREISQLPQRKTKRPSILDKFLIAVFKFAKIISVLFVGLCLITIIFCIICLFISSGRGIELPSFEKAKTLLETKTESGRYIQHSTKVGSERKIERNIKKKYGVKVVNITNKYSLPGDAYDILIRHLVRLGAKYRSPFITGLDDFLSDADTYIKDKGDKTALTITDALNLYSTMFTEAISEKETSAAAAKYERIRLLSIIGGAVIVLIAFVGIPLLIQIEQNTRNLA